MNNIERINKYENILDNSNNNLKNFEELLNKFADIQKDIKELNKYYGSDNWYQDIDDYNNGNFSKNIKAGILSEDAIYDLIMKNRNLAIQMLEIATKILKSS